MNKPTITTAIAVSAAVIFAITTLLSCNGKAKAEQRYESYHTQAETFMSQQQTTITKDSAAIAAYTADLAQVHKLAGTAETALEQISAITTKHQGN